MKNKGTEDVSEDVRSSERLRNSKIKSKFYKPNNVEKSRSQNHEILIDLSEEAAELYNDTLNYDRNRTVKGKRHESDEDVRSKDRRVGKGGKERELKDCSPADKNLKKNVKTKSNNNNLRKRKQAF